MTVAALTVDQVAAALGVKPPTVREWVRRGAPTVTLGDPAGGRGRGSTFDLETLRAWRLSNSRIAPEGSDRAVSIGAALRAIERGLWRTFSKPAEGYSEFQLWKVLGLPRGAIAGILAQASRDIYRELTGKPCEALGGETVMLATVFVESEQQKLQQQLQKERAVIGNSIGEAQRIERALARLPIVKIALEQEKQEAAAIRRAAIASYRAADERLAAAQRAEAERMPGLEAELASLEAKFVAARSKIEVRKQAISQEVALARVELFNATQAIRELPALSEFQLWQRRTSRAMELSSPRVDPRPVEKGFRDRARFEAALGAWNARTTALRSEIDETAIAARAVMNMAVFSYPSDAEAIAACEAALLPFKKLVNWPSSEKIETT